MKEKMRKSKLKLQLKSIDLLDVDPAELSPINTVEERSNYSDHSFQQNQITQLNIIKAEHSLFPPINSPLCPNRLSRRVNQLQQKQKVKKRYRKTHSVNTFLNPNCVSIISKSDRLLQNSNKKCAGITSSDLHFLTQSTTNLNENTPSMQLYNPTYSSICQEKTNRCYFSNNNENNDSVFDKNVREIDDILQKTASLASIRAQKQKVFVLFINNPLR